MIQLKKFGQTIPQMKIICGMKMNIKQLIKKVSKQETFFLLKTQKLKTP
jgi:hypothetical protein